MREVEKDKSIRGVPLNFLRFLKSNYSLRYRRILTKDTEDCLETYFPTVSYP